ncbi:DUF4468 domain-containing protein [Mucilaginibacter sp. 21P]|uniref:DUF4468 domain-containing protein n=1 Tax=Mucilaginibacter sp. 21P TaxID=2778902 RepID=UPI001C590413|nr:DUF4468 domain-containing protein [Mucilaginibacter sp. 21P]QXV64767.1 DUF4468 domain-containing protein [Mucilaginibacter sp. 21P]
MKKALLLVTLLFATAELYAQKDSLQLDENNEYVYYKVVSKPELSADSVYARAWKFAAALSKDTKPKKGKADKAFNVAGKFINYSGTSLVRKESGEVSYTLNFQAADGKYRYKFGDFVYTPYKRDRYGNMVAVQGVHIDLKNLTSKYSQKDADDIYNQVATGCITTELRLKQSIDNDPPVMKRPEVKKVHTGNW